MYHGQVCLVKLCGGNTGVDECSTVEVPIRSRVVRIIDNVLWQVTIGSMSQLLSAGGNQYWGGNTQKWTCCRCSNG